MTDHADHIYDCPGCDWCDTLREVRIEALERQYRQDTMVGRVVGTVLLALIGAMLVFLLTGCGAVEQHKADQAQEARLAAIEARLVESEARRRELVAFVAEALARVKAEISAARKLIGGVR